MGATTEFALVYFGLFSLASGCTRLTSQSVSLSLFRDPVITKPPRQDSTSFLGCHVGDGHGGEQGSGLLWFCGVCVCMCAWVSICLCLCLFDLSCWWGLIWGKLSWVICWVDPSWVICWVDQSWVICWIDPSWVACWVDPSRLLSWSMLSCLLSWKIAKIRTHRMRYLKVLASKILGAQNS